MSIVLSIQISPLREKKQATRICLRPSLPRVVRSFSRTPARLPGALPMTQPRHATTGAGKRYGSRFTDWYDHDSHAFAAGGARLARISSEPCLRADTNTGNGRGGPGIGIEASEHHIFLCRDDACHLHERESPGPTMPRTWSTSSIRFGRGQPDLRPRGSRGLYSATATGQDGTFKRSFGRTDRAVRHPVRRLRIQRL